MYKFFCFEIEIKTKADLYMPCEAMAHSTKYKSGKVPNQNDVQIVDRSYLQKNFKVQSEVAQKLIQDVIDKFELNSEHKKAFRIIANHVGTPVAEQLIMYLGGMCGTGKSQVIKSLMHFLKSKNEFHRFVVVAPTGAAAALLHGSVRRLILLLLLKYGSMGGHEMLNLAVPIHS
jgi:hypothetical protein